MPTDNNNPNLENNNSAVFGGANENVHSTGAADTFDNITQPTAADTAPIKPVGEVADDFVSANKTEDTQQTTEKVLDFTEEAEAAEKKKDAHKKSFSVLKMLFIIVAAFFIILSIFGIWNRWFRYDDAKDLISNWQVSGTDTVVNIDGKQIHLDKNTIFNYEIDTGAKLLYLKTGEYTGTCHYRFSWDRCQIAFIDSGDKNAISTTWADLCWFSDFITCKMSGIGLSPAYTKASGQDVDTTDTGLDDIIANGQTQTILLDKISTKQTTATS